MTMNTTPKPRRMYMGTDSMISVVRLRNYEFHPGFDLVRIGKFVLVCFEDFHVLICVAIEFLADL